MPPPGAPTRAMYLRATGERSCGSMIASTMANVSRRPASASASRSSATVSTRAPQPPHSVGQLRVGPARQVEQVLPVGDRPEDPPAGVVDHQHDRVGAVARRLRDLGAGHLEGAVAAEHQRPPAGADLRADRAGHAEPHRGVVALREVAGRALDAHVEAGEERVARLGDEEVVAPAAQEAVDLPQHVADADRAAHRRAAAASGCRRRRRARGGAAGRGAASAVDEVAQRDVVVGMEADVDAVVDGRDRAAPGGMVGARSTRFMSVSRVPRLSTTSARVDPRADRRAG